MTPSLFSALNDCYSDHPPSACALNLTKAMKAKQNFTFDGKSDAMTNAFRSTDIYKTQAISTMLVKNSNKRGLRK